MIPELGHFCLILALCLALTQAILPLFGIYQQNQAWMRSASSTALGQCLFLLLSFLSLAYAFISNDFSVRYVAENSNSLLPTVYRFCAIWGAHEGSLLLWVTLLSGWTLAVSLLSKTLPLPIRAQVLSILAMISGGFLLFLLLTSDPFLRFLPAYPMDGRDLNPLLQDPGLVSHPPMLYMGYVGFAVAFAFAMTALMPVGKSWKVSWVAWVRPWTLMAWCFLSLGIVLGSWWAYRELGWGGWWFWDPVENASFLPWLAGTALIHALILTEKREVCQAWTVLLAICTFSLSLMGTFLVRSGILVSVHTFANDAARGRFLLLFLGVVVAGSLTLYARRAHTLQYDPHPPFGHPRNECGAGSLPQAGEGNSLLSRQTLLLSNNIILMVAMLTILLGTLYPLIMDALGGQKISVGFPYFNSVFIPLMTPLFMLMGIAPYCRWEKNRLKDLSQRLWCVLLLSLLFALILPWIFIGSLKISVILTLGLAFWILLSSFQYFLLFKKHIPMLVAHGGVAILLIGIGLSSAYSIHQEVRMTVGDTLKLGDYQFHFLGTEQAAGPNYKTMIGDILVFKKDAFLRRLKPERRIFTVQNMPLSKTAIEVGVFRDLYVALGEQLGDKNTWSLRIYIKPFVRWIWMGGLIMILGGLLAFFSSRKKRISS